MKLSLVIPCYNEEENIRPFFDLASSTLSALEGEMEMIFINDGSTDRTKEELKRLCETESLPIRVITFSRNFGKEAAMVAGLRAARGEYTAIIDGDLQQHPRYVLEMLHFLEENPDYDGAAAYQKNRREGKLLRFFKAGFYKIINGITKIEFYRAASDFRVLRRNMVEAVLSLPEKCRFSKGIFPWVGFQVKYLPYEVAPRHGGKTKWSFWRLLAYAMDGIVAFSDKPLIISSVLGFLLFLSSIFMMLWTVIKTLLFGDPVAGYPTLASLILLLSGIQLLCLGLMGQYMAKIYTESKERPLFVIKDEFDNEKTAE